MQQPRTARIGAKSRQPESLSHPQKRSGPPPCSGSAQRRTPAAFNGKGVRFELSPPGGEWPEDGAVVDVVGKTQASGLPGRTE